ncbi:Mu transposase C-terminal domain-containing protein [Streptomyces ardesiacus]|uniref:Mu transposase C-terminal domain-containing protein n=1 Tax=Streptomyces ardesiacus TaxID=285564 RepID=UPI00363D27B7
MPQHDQGRRRRPAARGDGRPPPRPAHLARRPAHGHTPALPHQWLAALDERLAGAAARPVVLPETIVIDRGKVFVSAAFTAACEHLGISVQPAPPHAPTAKGIVERTFGTINHLFCQHLPGYTGSDVTRRGPDTEKDACYSVPPLQDLLDEWLVHYHHRPHEGLRHPLMPRKALTPNQMPAALIAVAGHVPVPLTGRDYLELLPVRWQATTPAGITIHHRTYDADLLAPYRGQASPVAGRGGKWEIHYNPHDVRQIWIRLTDGHLTEIPWIHRNHVHQPFNDDTWQHIRTHAQHSHHDDSQQHEAHLADALDQLMRRVHSGHATTAEQALLARATTTPIPTARPPPRHHTRHRPAGTTRRGRQHRQPRRPSRRRHPPRRGHRIRALRHTRGSRQVVNTRPHPAAHQPPSAPSDAGSGNTAGAVLAPDHLAGLAALRHHRPAHPTPSPRPARPRRSRENHRPAQRRPHLPPHPHPQKPRTTRISTRRGTARDLGRHATPGSRPDAQRRPAPFSGRRADR